MRAEIEVLAACGGKPRAGIIRVWRDSDAYGDPYRWAGSVRWLNPQECEILGHTARLTPAIYRALVEEFARWGVSRIKAVTYRNRVRREKWIQVPKQEGDSMKRYRLQITVKPIDLADDGSVDPAGVDAVTNQEYGFSSEATRIDVQKAVVATLNEALTGMGHARLESKGKGRK